MDQHRQRPRLGAGQNYGQHARAFHGRHRARGIVGRQQLAHLGAHPLARELRHALGPRGTGGEPLRVEPFVGRAVDRMKAEEAQDAQVILLDPPDGIAHEAHPSRDQVGQPAQRVDDRARGLGIKRVHREVAPRRILGHVGREGHHGVAPEGLDIAAEGRDLVRHAARDHRHGAMIDAGGHHLESGRRGQSRDRRGHCIGRQIDVRHGPAQECIAHAAAHEERAMPRLGQHGAEPLRRGPHQPVARDPHPCILRARPCRMRAVAPRCSRAHRARHSSAASRRARAAAPPGSGRDRAGGRAAR